MLEKSASYSVCEAGSTAEAHSVWEQNREKIQLLFTDIVLPDGMSGWKLAETLRAEQPQLKVIYSTGFDAESVQRLDAPANQVLLHKPYAVQSLVHVIRECLDGGAAGQALDASKVS